VLVVSHRSTPAACRGGDGPGASGACDRPIGGGLRVDAKSFGNLSIVRDSVAMLSAWTPGGFRLDSGRIVQRIELTGGCAT
jgi:hypothetical protein